MSIHTIMFLIMALDRSNYEIMDTNPARGIDVLYCACSALAMGPSPVQEVLPK